MFEATNRRESGWTFIETLISIAIILILTGTVGFTSVRYLHSARVAAARSQIDTFSLALSSYLFDVGEYPSQDQGLASLWQQPSPPPPGWSGPYIETPVPVDPWGRPYEYRVPGPSGLPFGIQTLGIDGLEGGEGNAKDITSWDR